MKSPRYWPAVRIRNFVKEYYKRNGLGKPPRLPWQKGLEFLAEKMNVTPETFAKTNPILVVKYLLQDNAWPSVLGRMMGYPAFWKLNEEYQWSISKPSAVLMWPKVNDPEANNVLNYHDATMYQALEALLNIEYGAIQSMTAVNLLEQLRLRPEKRHTFTATIWS